VNGPSARGEGNDLRLRPGEKPTRVVRTMSALETKIEDLDVSVRTLAYLRELGVDTVGALLALPTLEAQPRILEELHSLFDELDVQYEGTLLLVAPEATERAVGTVRERWAAIAAWLEREHPERLADFAPGATPEAITSAAAALGAELPAEYTEFLTLHDGQQPGAPMLESASLLPLAEVVRRHRILADLFPQQAPIDAAEVDREIRPLELSPGWIPIGVSARGRDVLCLDLDPGEQGTRGQVILVVLDDDVRMLVAPGFADLLARYFEEVQTGELDLDLDLEDADAVSLEGAEAAELPS